MTPIQHKTLEAIRRLSADGVSPSLTEIAAAVGVSSRGRVHAILSRLRDQGIVDWWPGRQRSITIVSEGPTKDQMSRWSSAELSRVRTEAYAILSDRLDETPGQGARRVSA
jgi:SOS-response transcriptional repressor LexA